MSIELQNALALILEDLEVNNDHTTGRLLEFAYGLHPQAQDELLYRARLSAQHMIYNREPETVFVCPECETETNDKRGDWCKDCDKAAN